MLGRKDYSAARWYTSRYIVCWNKVQRFCGHLTQLSAQTFYPVESFIRRSTVVTPWKNCLKSTSDWGLPRLCLVLGNIYGFSESCQLWAPGMNGEFFSLLSIIYQLILGLAQTALWDIQGAEGVPPNTLLCHCLNFIKFWHSYLGRQCVLKPQQHAWEC